MKRKHAAALRQAAEALGRGDDRTAEALCRKVIEDDVASVDAIHLLALARKQSGDVHEAAGLMQRALELEPGRADIHANFANLLAAANRGAEAEPHYRRALDIAPGFRAARIGLARLLVDLNRAHDALAAAERLTAANPSDVEAWNVIGTANRQLGRIDAAERAFRRALSIAPDYAIARHNLGAMLASVSRSEEALDELELAAAAGVGGPEIAHNRAAALMSLGRLDEAEALLRHTLASLPRAVTPQMLLASIRYMRGDRQFADVLGAAVAGAPADVALRVAYARILSGADEDDMAEATLRTGLEETPHDARLLAEMSRLKLRNSKHESGLDFARRAVAAAPDDPALNDLVVQALLSLGDGAEAMPLIEAARRRAPLNQYYIALEATAARLTGDSRYETLYDYDRFVRRFDLDPPEGWSTIDDFHRDLIAVLDERHRFVAPPLDQSLRGGTQTPRGLLNDPDPTIRAFLDAIRAPIAAYRDAIGTDAAHPFTVRNHGDARLIGCWSVRLRREGFHINHVHSEGWISSAYYVDVPEEVRDEDSKSGWIKFGEPGFFVPGAGPGKLLQPAAGVLVLFPSYLWHGTTPIHGDEPRLTIAFDVVPTPR